MNNKIIIQSLTLLFIVSLGAAFYQSNQIRNANEMLAAKKDTLKTQTEELEFLRNQLIASKDTLAKTLEDCNNQLTKLSNEALESAPRVSPNKPKSDILAKTKNDIQKTEAVVQKADNSKYLVTIHSLPPDLLPKNQMLHSLRSQGYRVIDGNDYSEKPDWMALSSTVFYYSSSSKPIAQKMAANLSSKTGLTFLSFSNFVFKSALFFK